MFYGGTAMYATASCYGTLTAFCACDTLQHRLKLCVHIVPCFTWAQSVRQELHDHLVRINPDKKWDFIVDQVRLPSALLQVAATTSACQGTLCCVLTSLSHVHPQIGMFSYTGMTPAQVGVLLALTMACFPQPRP